MEYDDGEDDDSLKERLAGRFSGLVRIGEGAFSVVYRASMVEQPAKQVALKCINPTCAPSRVVAEMDHLIALQYVVRALMRTQTHACFGMAKGAK